MRIDLFTSVHRPWYMDLGLKLARWRVGAVPGPPLAISYRPDLFKKRFCWLYCQVYAWLWGLG